MKVSPWSHVNPVNARWQRRRSAQREVIALCATTLAKLQAGEHASVRDLITGAHGATGMDDDPAVAQSLDAARRLATAWSDLCYKANLQEQALAETRDLAARLAGELHGIVDRVRDSLSLTPPDRLAIRSSAPAPPAAVMRPPQTARQNPVSPSAAGTSGAEPAAPVLAAYVLGPFRAVVNDQAIEGWLNCKGKAIFKYLLLNRNHPVAKEVLMDVFWPKAKPEAARNNLNVAVHRLRRALGRASGPDDGAFPFVLFADGHYVLNPKLTVSIDADRFLAHATSGSELECDQQADVAVREYAACIALYRGELLADDRYDGWLAPLRQQFRDRYLHVLDRTGRIHFDRRDHASCTMACARILAVDACNEEAHRMLMRCYARLGQPQLAHRQYRTCVEVLNRELGIPASAETTDLYQEIVRRRAA